MYRFIKAPEEAVNSNTREETNKAKKEKENEKEKAAFGTYASQGGQQFVYRVKKGGAFGGYKIVTETTNTALDRESLLDMRTKKKSDRSLLPTYYYKTILTY
jgi:hypothetical protein